MIINSDLLKERMNKYGGRGIPFFCCVDFELTKGIFMTDPLTATDVEWQIDGVGNTDVAKERHAPVELENLAAADHAADYHYKFGIFMDALMKGNSFFENLTMATPVATDLTLEELYHRGNAPTKLLIPGEFVCFTPNKFVTITADNHITATVMNGSIRANAEDAEATLLNSYKELCEHNSVVDLLRNDLSMVARRVRVESFRDIIRIDTPAGGLMHTFSTVGGALPAAWRKSLGDILFTLLPAGALSGAPKPSSLRIIADAEGEPRGWYCGMMGYFDGASFTSALMIRGIQRVGDRLFFHSGSGISINSNVDDEYAEAMEKIYIPV
jgi:para-aminobenzoate synthetase component 1